MRNEFEEYAGPAARQQRLTDYPLTFHAYGFADDGSPDDFDLSHYDATYILGDNEYYLCGAAYYINPHIHYAHKQISNSGENPFLAWMTQTGTGFDKLPELLGDKRCTWEIFDKYSDFFPPAEGILKFCRGLGIHPAYLQRGLKDQDSSYHQLVLHAMTKMLKSPETLPHDREICLKAFRAEMKRCQAYANENREAAELIVKAMTRMAFAQPAANRGENDGGLIEEFRSAIGLHRTNLEESLNRFELRLKRDSGAAVRLHQASKLKCEIYETAALQAAMVFYGDKAKACLSQILTNSEDAILQRRPFVKNPALTVSEIKSIVDIQDEDINFLADSENDPNDEFIKLYEERADLINAISMYLREQPKLEKTAVAGNLKSSEYQAFRKWHARTDTWKYDVPMFRNFLLIQPYLGQDMARFFDKAGSKPPLQKTLTYGLK